MDGSPPRGSLSRFGLGNWRPTPALGCRPNQRQRRADPSQIAACQRPSALVVERAHDGCLLWVVGHKVSEHLRLNPRNLRANLGSPCHSPLRHDFRTYATQDSDGKDKDAAMVGFVVLAGLFIASLVSCNLIFRKFFGGTLAG